MFSTYKKNINSYKILESMATLNNSVQLTETDILAIKQALQTITDKLPFLVALSTDEKKSLAKLGAKSVEFVKDCNSVAENYNEILPNNFNREELHKDTRLYTQLSELQLLFNTLSEKLNDTTIVVGSKALKSSLIVYDYVKTAAKTQAGLKTVSEQLQQRFKGQGKPKKTTNS